MIGLDIFGRLAGVVGVPVLLPEEIETPTKGAGKGEKTGIPGYLARTAPDGYVQVESPQPISAADYVATYWVPVSAVAPTEAQAHALAESVRRALCGSPWEPGPYARVIPDRARLVEGGFYLARQTYEIPEIDGGLAV